VCSVANLRWQASWPKQLRRAWCGHYAVYFPVPLANERSSLYAAARVELIRLILCCAD